ncbi:energy transducer TonB [Dechloromonas sp. ZY10]|uniref:energy transducer TonB family protein n=1 Tax=Dechloromonas aquae TaxID=2664436 RepID=UPI0035273ED1
MSVLLHLGLLALPAGSNWPAGAPLPRQALQVHWQAAAAPAAELPRPRRHDLLVARNPGPPAEQSLLALPATGEPARVEPVLPVAETEPSGEAVWPQVHYYRRAEVDRGPQIVEDVAANGSPLAETLGRLATNGRMVLELWINAGGQVDRSEVLTSSLNPATEALVRNAFGQARFQPARKGEQVVASRLLIELTVADVPSEPAVPSPLAPVTP